MSVREPTILGHYQKLRGREGLDVLCLQECVDRAGRTHGSAIAADLGAAFRVIDERADETDETMVYDSSRLELVELRVLDLPRLPALSLFQRWLLGRREPQRHHAQLALFRVPATGRMVTVVNFHLDCVGSLDHQRSQIAFVRRELERLQWPGTVVACGDTNAFAVRRQLSALAWVLAPFGFTEIGRRPTHWFARAREEELSHRMAVALGRIGLDLPHRYDVVCASSAVRAHGQVTTPESDHDLVWASVAA